ncbi:peptidoglycan-binding protein [Loktanella sp. S4079]|nr:peptidoglycan-binding protein [Loktanella sp. S4079]
MRSGWMTAMLMGLACSAAAEDTALLIGIERYENLRRVASADDIIGGARSLRNAGFVVDTSSDSTAAELIPLLNQFAQEAQSAERLIVGLSGRFVTDGASSWFLAADSDSPAPFNAQAVSLDSILTVLGAAPGQAILVLGYDLNAQDQFDAYLREGIGQLDIPQGVTVVHGAPNTVDDLIPDAVAQPGTNLMQLLRDNRRLTVEGYQPDQLILRHSSDDQVAQAPSTLPFWTKAQETDTADAYRDFALSYPDSPYAAEARRRLDAIENDPQRLAEIAEQDLSLTRNERREIQRDLTLLDYSTRGVDGIFGPGSRRAIRNWQQTNGFAQTSFLTAEQINRIDAQASRKQAEIDAEAERVRQETERLDRAYWEETGARGDVAGYRAYLNRYPEGLFSQEAKDALAEEEQDQRESASEVEQRLDINPVVARLIESRLAQMGFNPGRVDGRFDNDTRGAIGRYQTRSGLPATGYLDEPTLARLLADTFGR